jgi:hypothetical protein
MTQGLKVWQGEFLGIISISLPVSRNTYDVRITDEQLSGVSIGGKRIRQHRMAEAAIRCVKKNARTQPMEEDG